jgi:tetratricopeptide (TPR) repeat protein
LARASAVEAQVHLALERFKEARAAAEEAVSMDARCADGYFAEGLVYSALRVPDAARDAFLRSLDLDPTCARAQYELARTLQALKDDARASAALREAGRLEPQLYASRRR